MGTAFTAWLHYAVTCHRAQPVVRETFGSPMSWLNSFAQKQGTGSRSKLRRIPNITRRRRSPSDDLQSFVRKVNAGADSAITQYFYNFDAYARFVDDVHALGCTVPIVAGIMPIVSYTQLARFSDACGAEIPRWVRRRLESFGDDRASIREFGLDVVTELCERLLAAGAPGLHFYTLNQAEATVELCERLR